MPPLQLCKKYKYFFQVKGEGNTQELPSPFGRVRAHDFFLQRSFFVCSISVICSRHLLFATLVFICSVLFSFTAYFFYLQRFFFVCSVSFLFAATLLCLRRLFFVCSVSFLFAACPLWAIVVSSSTVVQHLWHHLMLYLACTHDMSPLWQPKQQKVSQEFTVSRRLANDFL